MFPLACGKDLQRASSFSLWAAETGRCLIPIFFFVALFAPSALIAQSGAPASKADTIPAVQGGQESAPPKDAKGSQQPQRLPESLLQSIQKFQNLWSTEFTSQDSKSQQTGAFTFSIKGLENFQVSYRFPRDLRATKFYPPLDGDEGKFPVPGDKNIFLVEFTACGDKLPCKTPAAEAHNIDNPSSESECSATHISNESESGTGPCTVDVVFVRDLRSTGTDGKTRLKAAFVITQSVFAISEDLIKLAKQKDAPTFVVNNLTLEDYFSDESFAQVDAATYTLPGPTSDPQPMSLITGWATVRDFSFERFAPDTSCRPYEGDPEVLSISRPNYKPTKLGKDNGITLYPPKVFDVFTLRQMLASTAAQLAALSGFSQTSINNAFGNLQGVTTDTSYLSAQATTAATPTVVSQE
jgi:hypothetical protein